MTPAKLYCLLIFLWLLSGVASAQVDSAEVARVQNDSAENIYFVKNRDSAAIVYEPDYMPDANAFYLYRNCIYNLVLRDGRHLCARIVEIRDELLSCMSYYNEPARDTVFGRRDSFQLDPHDIMAIKMPDRPGLGLYRYFSLKGALVLFKKGSPKTFPQGYSVLGMGELTYGDRIYNNLMDGYDFSMARSRKLRTGIGFTPSMALETRGINLSFQTIPVQHRKITIKGLNVDAGLYSGIFSIKELFYLAYENGVNNLADSLTPGGKAGRIYGLSVSGGGLVGDFVTNGVSINGGGFMDYAAKGLVISGLQNTTMEFDGAAISGLRNRSVKGRGMQLGLLNVCKDLKGIQIGLWNVNRKRSLPLINWEFRS